MTPLSRPPNPRLAILREVLDDAWKTPLGFLGVLLCTVSLTSIIIALGCLLSGLISNPYFSIFTFLFLPAILMVGLCLIPLSYYLQRKKWFPNTHHYSQHLIIDLGNKRHRKKIILFLVLTLVNGIVVVLIAYQSYQFTDSSYFCGVVCHEVMDPEYTAYQRSAHAKVPCVSCHIGPGSSWYVRAKLSGIRQVKAIIEGNYNRPIPAPITHLRPERETCESCHWPDKFHGKKSKEFMSFTNEDLSNPHIQEISLRIGGRRPGSDTFEGIHWHVSRDIKVEYLPLNPSRTKIGRVKVTKQGGITDEYVLDTDTSFSTPLFEWRTMDCIDCHNRPTHIYESLEEVIDYGLFSQGISPLIPGIREDSLKVLTTEYTSREEAIDAIPIALTQRITKRHGSDFTASHLKELQGAGAFLLEAYLNNVWPSMKVTWGTYRSHLGHQDAALGYGCFRCHDGKHHTESGKIIKQDCDMCHDEPE